MKHNRVVCYAAAYNHYAAIYFRNLFAHTHIDTYTHYIYGFICFPLPTLRRFGRTPIKLFMRKNCYIISWVWRALMQLANKERVAGKNKLAAVHVLPHSSFLLFFNFYLSNGGSCWRENCENLYRNNWTKARN